MSNLSNFSLSGKYMVAAKSVKSKLWFMRLDGPEEHLRQKCGELSRSLDTVAMLAAFHKGKRGENPHCHVCIEISSEVQKQSFAVRMKSLFGITQKSQYALDVWDGNRGKGAVSYLFHEEDEVILCRKSFTDEELDDAREANAAVQAVVNVNKEKASVKLVERALAEFEGAVYTVDLKFRVLRWMLGEIKQGKHYHPGSFMLKKYVEEVEIRICNEEDLDVVAERMFASLWRS